MGPLEGAVSAAMPLWAAVGSREWLRIGARLGSIAAMAWWGIPTARGLGLEPARLTFSQDRTRVRWLVDRQLRAARHGHHRYAPPPLIADRPEGCAGVAEPGDGGR